MNKLIKKIETEQAPKAVGPYSQAVLAGAFLFVSGQVPIDPAVGTITETTIQGQTKQVLDNIEAILKAAGLTLAAVVKTEVFLKHMSDFQEMNRIYAERFAHFIKPARQTIEAAKLPLDALVEISCIAVSEY
jgi:2-iminobutanoate/2-iminopropanoate deaminase